MKLNFREALLIKSDMREKVHTAHLQKIFNNHVSLKASDKVLEIGCGTGFAAAALVKANQLTHYTAEDLDEEMIALAKEKNGLKQITYTTGSATQLQHKDNSFDKILSFGVMHHIPDREKAIQEISRTIKPGGTFFCIESSIESFQKPVGIFRKMIFEHPYEEMYTLGQLLTCCNKYNLDVISYTSYGGTFNYYFALSVKKRII